MDDTGPGFWGCVLVLCAVAVIAVGALFKIGWNLF
jgi:hypothetical protein